MLHAPPLNPCANLEAMANSPFMNPLRDPLDRRLPRMAGPCAIVLFGVTGDLARRKLLPAIYDLAHRGLLPAGFAVVGFGRRVWSDEQFVAMVAEAVKDHARTPYDENVFARLADGFRFVTGEFSDASAFVRLRETLEALATERGTAGNVAFYLSVPPSQFSLACRQLAAAGLAASAPSGDTFDSGPVSNPSSPTTPAPELSRPPSRGPSAAGDPVPDATPAPASRTRPHPHGWRRVIIEKPFGHDLASARELNRVINEVFPPGSVFRIDHYLGKETVQNLLALRFANEMFEPLWNRDHIDHVQITMAEDIGVGGRAGYYDGIGAARDVIQNHLLQLLALTAMEEPITFSAADVRAEKEKVLSAVRLPADVAEAAARGQYAAGWQGGEWVKGFLQEQGIAPGSRTETYAALRLEVDSRRWAGVPFYLRTGKRLGRRVTEIALVFNRPPRTRLAETWDRDPQTTRGNTAAPAPVAAARDRNAIVVRVQPDEGVTVRFGAKVPGTAMEIREVSMDFSYGLSFTEASPEAYERLILDCLLGDPPLFPQSHEVELSWAILDPVEQAWAQSGAPEPYAAGTWGPASADALLARDGRVWRRP